MTTTEQKVTQVYQTAIVGIHTVDQKGVLRDRPVLETAIIPKHSKMYGLRLSVDAEQLKGFRPGDQVTITVERGGERKSPPKWPSDWYWNLDSIVKGHLQQPHVSSDPDAGFVDMVNEDFPQRPATPPPGYDKDPYRQQQDEFRRSKEEMRWTEAINNATNMMTSTLALSIEERDEIWDAAQGIEQAILSWAAWYYQAITAGPPQDVPAEAPSEAAEPPEAPEPSGSTGPDPWAIVRQSLEQYNADLKAGARQGRVLQYERDVMPRVIYKFGGNLTLEQAATAASALAQGSIATWPTGGKV